MCFHGINMLRFIVCFLHLIICLVVNEVFQKMIFIKTRIVTYISNFKTLLQTNILQNASNLESARRHYWCPGINLTLLVYGLMLTKIPFWIFP